MIFTAELLVTNFVGVLFWLGFDEAKDQGSFAVPRRLWGRARKQTWDLYFYQYRIIKDVAKTASDREWYKSIGEKAWAWLNGDFVVPPTDVIRAELFLAGSLAALLQRDFSKLDGQMALSRQ